jgi:hypothetical protein
MWRPQPQGSAEGSTEVIDAPTNVVLCTKTESRTNRFPAVSAASDDACGGHHNKPIAASLGRRYGQIRRVS